MKSARATVVKTIPHDPETRWQMRQWHQPVSYGSAASRYRIVAHAHPPVSI
jgi:hypothetical protein